MSFNLRNDSSVNVEMLPFWSASFSDIVEHVSFADKASCPSPLLKNVDVGVECCLT